MYQIEQIYCFMSGISYKKGNNKLTISVYVI